MVAGQPVRVLYNALFAHVYEDGLTAHSTDVVREVLGWHPRCTVILNNNKKNNKKKVKLKNRRAEGRVECANVCLPQQSKP